MVVLKFHEWAYSDLMDNTIRGDFAEYLVAEALRLTIKPRKNWGPFDLKTEGGIKIEVKCSSSHQNWPHEKPRQISFQVPNLTRYWDGEKGKYVKLCPPRRVADVYIFCVLARKDGSRPDPLLLDDWTFHVVHKDLLDMNNRSSVAISRLRDICQNAALAAFSVNYDELAAAITRIGKQRRGGRRG